MDTKMIMGKPQLIRLSKTQPFQVTNGQGKWIVRKPFSRKFVGFSEDGVRETKKGGHFLILEAFDQVQDFISKTTEAVQEEFERHWKEIVTAFGLTEDKTVQIIPTWVTTRKNKHSFCFPTRKEPNVIK